MTTTTSTFSPSSVEEAYQLFGDALLTKHTHGEEIFKASKEDLTAFQAKIATSVMNWCSDYIAGVQVFTPSSKGTSSFWQVLPEFTLPEDKDEFHAFADHVRYDGGRVFFIFAEFLRWMCSEYDTRIVFYFLRIDEERDGSKIIHGKYKAIISVAVEAGVHHPLAVEFPQQKGKVRVQRGGSSLNPRQDSAHDEVTQLRAKLAQAQADREIAELRAKVATLELHAKRK